MSDRRCTDKPTHVSTALLRHVGIKAMVTYISQHIITIIGRYVVITKMKPYY